MNPERSYPPPGMLGPRAIAWWALRTMTRGVRVEGLENVPRNGPVLLLARHYHHLLDGAVLIERVPRPVHIVVGLDWTANAAQRRWMERACAAARWPVILRPRQLANGAYAPDEVARYLRSGIREAAALLAQGRVVVVFPEGRPAIDPASPDGAAPERDADGLLPFAPGYRTILTAAVRAGAREAAIVPVGFRYERRGSRWSVTARFGAPLGAHASADAARDAVRALSR